MPQMIRYIDDIAEDRRAPVLVLRFGDFDSLLSPAIRRKRQAVLARLDAEGVTWEACGAPKDSGWISYVGDVALQTPYAPGRPEYERVKRMFEEDWGERVDPEIALCLFIP